MIMAKTWSMRSRERRRRLSTDANWYIDVSAANHPITISFLPGQNSVGLELNDIVQPNKASVTVNFSDGSSTVFAPTLGGQTVTTTTSASGVIKVTTNDTTVSTDSTWFVGVIGSSDITNIQMEASDPFDIDNIYVANDANPILLSTVPLPTSGLAGLALMGFVACRAIRMRRARNIMA